ncbi:HNH endonuclease [Cognatishimia activa]|uniref:HNH endonuclease n=1 Tax=Cognatishimia activa TaxID=1715691 RepID=UPI002230FFF8|nr:HNH endonuclease [Cognatishimia activa]UZD90919.1 HNH endonuclease [Cognatishimia activa]
MQDPICPLCLRPIPADAKQSHHHLIPRLKGGKGGPTVLLHQICHNEIHATFTETELAREFNTIEALRSHERIAKFIAWITKRPATFHSRTPGPRRKR